MQLERGAYECINWLLCDEETQRHLLVFVKGHLRVAIANATSRMAHCMITWRHPQNRKYITHSFVVRGGPSRGRGNTRTENLVKFGRTCGFWTTFVKRFALCCRTIVCLSACLVTLVYCGQTVGWIKLPLGTEVGPGDTALDGDPAPPTESLGKGHSSPPPLFGPCLLLPNGRCQLAEGKYLINSNSDARNPARAVERRFQCFSLPLVHLTIINMQLICYGSKLVWRLQLLIRCRIIIRLRL